MFISFEHITMLEPDKVEGDKLVYKNINTVVYWYIYMRRRGHCFTTACVEVLCACQAHLDMQGTSC